MTQEPSDHFQLKQDEGMSDNGQKDDIRRAEWDCQQLFHRFFIAADAGDCKMIETLIDTDAEWIRANGPVVGKDAIVNAIRALPGTRVVQHVIGTMAVDIAEDGFEATGVAYVIGFVHLGESILEGPAPLDRPHSVLIFTPRFNRLRDGWRIAHISSRVRFMA